mmetsp:Transcript_126254/g.363162  ORF Transcript_126254/g.363162 Transcript_126254/m.363162 type:complete len:318 (+) Transcript_126254:113-1066(+)
MFWTGFVYIALPMGGLLSVMLGSGQTLPMACASKVLSTPITLGSARLSLAMFMSAICGILVGISYSGLRMSEVRLNEANEAGMHLAHAMAQRDLQQMKVFRWGRHFYSSLLGLTLWLTAWRLKTLYDGQQLSPPKADRRPPSIAARVFFIALGGLMFALADVPLCRINYNVQLLTSVTPRKMWLQSDARRCETAFAESAVGPCAEFCAEVEKLSKERLATIRWARDFHVLGSMAAKLFDDARGVEQGDQRIRELFQKKTCAEVLHSVDKSNQFVNAACIGLAVVAIVGAFVALSNAYEGSWSSAPAAPASNEVKKRD